MWTQRTLRSACIFVLFPIALHAQQSHFGEWKIDPLPALSPGNAPDWDDFAINSAAVVRLPDKWAMLYDGATLNEDGRFAGFGVAESGDGVRWTKRTENPVFVAARDPAEIATAPSVARWRDEWIVAYVVNRIATGEETPADDPKPPPEWVRLARSADGLNWEDAAEIKGAFLERTQHALVRPCLYSDGNAVHLWWIGESEKEEGPALFHSVSRDAVNWSKPNRQLTAEIDSRPIASARVQPSGDYYILNYVALDAAGPRLVSKVSQNARTWSAAGPPEFSLPAYFARSTGWGQPVPTIIFTKEGARLFYIDLLFGTQGDRPDPKSDPVTGAVLRTAFCAKK